MARPRSASWLNGTRRSACGLALVVGVGAVAALGCSTAPASPSSVAWTKNGSKYALTFGTAYLEVDAANGARISALRLAGEHGRDLVADSATTGEADNWGSTFWPSPQSWPWPPTDAGSINAINTLPYDAVNDALTLTLKSQVNATAPMVSVSKKFSVDTGKNALVIDYTMSNGGSQPVTVAPWEITRVPPGGLTFYGSSSAPVASSLPLMPTQNAAGATWTQHDPTDTTEYKLFADGQGWLAHAAGTLLLIKSFPDISAAQSATGEAEIEIYSAPKYVEIEQQGAVQTLGVGEALHWTVRWYVRQLAAPATLGSADLVAQVLSQIK